MHIQVTILPQCSSRISSTLFSGLSLPKTSNNTELVFIHYRLFRTQLYILVGKRTVSRFLLFGTVVYYKDAKQLKKTVYPILLL